MVKVATPVPGEAEARKGMTNRSDIYKEQTEGGPVE
jgi:hypothetical protein